MDAGPALTLALTSNAEDVVDVGEPSGETLSDIFNFSKFSAQILFGSGLGIGAIGTLVLGILLFLLCLCGRSLANYIYCKRR